eukprot:9503279-Pyramimonas_sp.AAC.1
MDAAHKMKSVIYTDCTGDQKKLKLKKVNIPVLPLHEVFGQLHDAGKERFERSVLGERWPSNLADFWAGVQNEPWAVEHRKHLETHAAST